MLVIYTQEITVGDKVFHTTTEERLECLWEWFWSCCNCNTHALSSAFQFSSSQEKRSSFSSTSMTGRHTMRVELLWMRSIIMQRCMCDLGPDELLFVLWSVQIRCWWEREVCAGEGQVQSGCNWTPWRIWSVPQDIESMLSKMYEDYTTNLVPDSRHWIVEENPGKCKTTPTPHPSRRVSIRGVDRF